MARYARGELHYGGALLTETESRTTWENVQKVIPFIEHADQIKSCRTRFTPRRRERTSGSSALILPSGS